MKKTVGEYQTTLELQSKEKVLLNGKLSHYEVGDKIKACGTFQKPTTNTNFYLFSYRNYLLSRGIAWSVQVKESKLLQKESSFFYSTKKKISSYLDTYQSSSYLYLFLLGDQSKLNKKIKTTYQTLGISHLFSISGMHISFLSGFFFSFFGKKKNKFLEIFFLFFLLFYLFLVGFTPSFIRGVCLYLFLLLKRWFSFSFPTSIFLYYLCLFFLFLNPYYFYSTSFLYSFWISFVLLSYQKELSKKNGYFKKLFFTSLIAFLSSIPIALLQNYELHPMSIFFNLLFVPFVSFFFFPCSFLLLLFPFLDACYLFFLSLLEEMATIFKTFSFSIVLGHPRFLFFFYFLGSFFCVRGIFYKRKKDFLLLVLLLIFQFSFPYFNPTLKITMLDVGQGDSILIELPYRKGVVLIDTGGKVGSSTNLTDTVLLPVLKARAIHKIDTLILSHGDSDHMNEGENLLNAYPIEKVIFNVGEYNELETSLISLLKKKKVSYYQNIETLKVGDNIFQFLNTKDYDEENNNSSVILFSYQGKKFLFMGDAAEEKERDLLKNYSLSNITFLKVGHHGSKTSSSKTFLEAITPTYSLISVGKNNRYGHPKEEVLERLKESTIYRTDLNGSIEIHLFQNRYHIKTCIK